MEHILKPLHKFENGIRTSLITANPGTMDTVELYSDFNHSKLVIGNSRGTVHNGPMKLTNVYETVNLTQLGHSIIEKPNNCLYSECGSTKTLSGINWLTPGNVNSLPYGKYMIHINGSIVMEGCNYSCLAIKVGLLANNDGCIEFMDDHILSLHSKFSHAPRTLNLSCSRIVTVDDSFSSVCPGMKMVYDNWECGDTYTVHLNTYSITRIA